MKQVGIFSTFRDPAALQLTDSVIQLVRHRYPGKAEVSFVFSNRDFGEYPKTTDKFLQVLVDGGSNLITFSAARFKPELRSEARQRQLEGDESLIRNWRNEFGAQVLERVMATDLDLLLGDMYIWGENMCAERNGVNLHPAKPDGPKGEWWEVIWELVKRDANESGVMMHAVVPELDSGPAATFSHYSIRGADFDRLWNDLPKDRQELDGLIAAEMQKREKTQHPLHQRIREAGLLREFPLVLQTTMACIEDKVIVEGGKVIKGGLDLTEEVEKLISKQETDWHSGTERIH